MKTKSLIVDRTTLPVIEERLYKESQSWHYVLTVTVPQRAKLRVLIERNAYDFQSRLRCQMWTPNGWTTVCHRPMNEAEAYCHSVSYGDRNPDINLFLADAQRLLETALQII